MAAARDEDERDYRIDISPDGTLSFVKGAAAKKPARGNSCDDILRP